MLTPMTAGIVEKRSVERVPAAERTTGFWGLFMLWVGFSISVARIWQGGVISGSGVRNALAAVVIAQAAWIYIAIGAVMGASEGLPGTMIMRAAFGIRGRVLTAVPLIIGTIGWFGLQLGITASALDIIIKKTYGGWGLSLHAQYVLWAFLMGVISVYGYRVVIWFQKVVSPLLLVLVPWMIYRMVSRYDVLAEFGRPRQATITTAEAITMLSGGVLAMLIAAADSSRYAKTRRTAFTAFMTATWFVGTLMFVIGIMGAVLVGTADPPSLVDKLGLGLAGLVIIVLAAWSTNCLNPYWGGIALSTLSTGSRRLPRGIPRSASTAIVVGLGCLTAILGIYSYAGFMTFVNVLASTLGPANGIIIADYFFLRGKGTNKLHAGELMKKGGKYWYSGGWNSVAVGCWLVGVAYSLIFQRTYILITPVSTQILSGLLYLAAMKTVGRRHHETSMGGSEHETA